MSEPTPAGHTVAKFAKRYRVSPDKVPMWIKKGELSAIDTAASLCGRPRFVIPREALAAFEQRRPAAQAASAENKDENSRLFPGLKEQIRPLTARERAALSLPRLTPPLKTHGGKSYLARRIVAMMPLRVRNANAPAPDDPSWLHYVEPFFGGGAILLALHPVGISEVANDLDGGLTNFRDVLRSPTNFTEFARLAQLTPFSEVAFVRARQECDSRSRTPVRRALSFSIRCRQSRQALGQDCSTPVLNRTRRRMLEHCSAWANAVGKLPAVHRRLQRVLILNRAALDVIRQEDGPRILFSLDCPYLQETRTAPGANGEFEMTEDGHRELLDTVRQV